MQTSRNQAATRLFEDSTAAATREEASEWSCTLFSKTKENEEEEAAEAAPPPLPTLYTHTLTHCVAMATAADGE